VVPVVVTISAFIMKQSRERNTFAVSPTVLTVVKIASREVGNERLKLDAVVMTEM